ncbi:MAG: phage virion morphogenesis protein [Zoogloeaceae bacterium]|jgi:phage virion morphogenesis protein|nr:phage virion morphogenesis protein [Zoogloeaceae bacterium]
MTDIVELVGADRLEATLDHMVGALSGAGMKRLMTAIARREAAENRKRIGANVAPDGTPFAPRKTRRGKKRGGIRDRMFQKLKTAKWLKGRSFPDAAKVFFIGRAAGMAKVHHFGLRDKLAEHLKRRVQYTPRPLLGISPGDREMIENMVIDRITEAM